jgi:hypothetical protein
MKQSKDNPIRQEKRIRTNHCISIMKLFSQAQLQIMKAGNKTTQIEKSCFPRTQNNSLPKLETKLQQNNYYNLNPVNYLKKHSTARTKPATANQIFSKRSPNQQQQILKTENSQ